MPSEPECPSGEALIVEALDKGDVSIGDLLNVCDTFVPVAVAEARELHDGAATAAAKVMRKRWTEFREAFNRLALTCRAVDEQRRK